MTQLLNSVKMSETSLLKGMVLGIAGIITMSERRVWKSGKVVLMGILATVILTTCLLGCDAGVSEEVPARNQDGSVSEEVPARNQDDGVSDVTPDQDAFIADRVVEIRVVMNDDDWTSCQLNALEKQYVQADFWFDGELIPDVAVRPKGNSSLRHVAGGRSPRLSLKVDFNLFNAAQTFRGLKKLNLNNGFKDPTLIRERIAYELFDYMGIPVPRSSHVDLWVNDTHLGVYTMVAEIDKTFLQQHFPSNDGNLYKPESEEARLYWTEAKLERERARLASTQNDDVYPRLDVNPSGVMAMGLRTNENNPDHSALLHFIDVINNEPDETFYDEIEELLDVDGALRFLAVSTLLVHLDNYLGSGHNYYLYELDDKFTILAWDLNEAFGTFTCGIKREGLINYYIDEPTAAPSADYPLARRLLSYQPYLDTYHGYLEELLDGPFAVDAMKSRVDEFANLIRPFVKSDRLKFFSTSDFERNLVDDVAPYIGLKTFVVERSESVKQQLEGERPSTGNGRGNGATRLGGKNRGPGDRMR